MDKSFIVNALRKNGVQEGMCLEVHSSLKSFGYVEGGAETVISALKECVGSEGTIFMPALRLSPALPLTDEDKKLGITCKIKILPDDRKKSAMGIIADTFRLQDGTLTGSGIMQISGWGKHAHEAVTGGLNFAIQNGGKALLLGVDIYKLTAMHYVEEITPKEISDMFAPNAEINKIYPPEEWFIEAGNPPVKAWCKIQKAADEMGFIKHFEIGSCKAMLFDVGKVVPLYKHELKTDPFGFWEIKKKA